jgi:hypothetical protein
MLTVVRIKYGNRQSMSIFILKMPFAIEKRISVSALFSKINKRLLSQ